MSRPLRIVCVGGGPGGLYFALLMKRADPRHDVIVMERNRADDTFGFGVVFSDATMAGIADADSEAYAAIARHLVHWDDIAVHYGGEVVRSTGHGFSGMSRHTLLRVLQDQARDAGVRLEFEREITALDELEDADLIVGADGVNSIVRRLLGPDARIDIDVRPNRFVWLGTTRPFPEFTFYFRTDHHGLWRVHAYQYAPDRSTFIVECRDETWRSAGLDRADESVTAGFLEALFSDELAGHRLIANKSVWRQFPTVRVDPWSAGDVVLLGDAAHTAHFSVGSGTRMAMEDAVALRNALVAAPLPNALAAFESARRPQIESLQRAAHASLQWFEDTERYVHLHPLQFAFTLLTRSLRITHEDLRKRDPAFLEQVDRLVATEAHRQVTGTASTVPACVPPPMFTPFRLRDLVIPNRVVVSPMCQYVADDGTVGDWHLVHLGSRAVGGAGLVMAEMTDVSRDARISVACAGLYKPEHRDAWKRVVDFIHRETPARIGIQLGHAGRKGATRKLWEGDSEPLESGAWPIVSASPIPYFPDRSQTPREMSRRDMDDVREDFIRAAELARAAGFDLLEVHMAHGYLLASFISPLTNTRTDDYGGGLANRMRFPLEVFDACREVWPPERPMSVRISAVDWLPGGLEPGDAVDVARLLHLHGCDVIDVSAGQTVPDQRPVYGRLFQTPFADRIRHDVKMATMAVGNISSFMDVNTIIAAGRADLCLLARAHLFDPYWTRHAAYMLGHALPWPDPYRSVERYTPRFEFHFGGDA
ncbi:MAG TPA: bifunctional salicylyl-CoA 5-hydroxylase/oxidoreductase [Vicinamibacterales bacterium]|nr:bifunctional salicylyl-CoA 5-hydroxylase/oxidoreductase [Vicinamibacterales bacterium]